MSDFNEALRTYVNRINKALNDILSIKIEEGGSEQMNNSPESLVREESSLFTKNDPVNHPSHYTDGKIEVIDFIEDKKLGFHLGNAVKYIARSGKKDPAKTIEDLEKARWYLDRYISKLKDDSSDIESPLKQVTYTWKHHGDERYKNDCSRTIDSDVYGTKLHIRDLATENEKDGIMLNEGLINDLIANAFGTDAEHVTLYTKNNGEIYGVIDNDKADE